MNPALEKLSIQKFFSAKYFQHKMRGRKFFSKIISDYNYSEKN